MADLVQLTKNANFRRVAVVAAVVAVVGLGWLTGTIASKSATEDSRLADSSAVRVMAPGSSSCGAQERTVSVVADRLGDSTDQDSYPILGLQSWSFVLHYDPTALRFIRDAGSVSVPVGSDVRNWTLWPADVAAEQGTVTIVVSSKEKNPQLPRAGAIRPEPDQPLVLGSVVFAPIAPGYSRISVDSVTLTPVGDSTPLPAPTLTDAVVATSCA